MFKEREIPGYLSRFYENTHSKQLIVFLPSVRAKKIYPYYPRIGWSESLNKDFNLLYIADPFQDMEIYQEAGGSWFICPEGKSVLPDLALKINEFVKNQNFADVYFYGSSMGGYAAIILSILTPRSIAFAECPQIYLEKHPGSINVIQKTGAMKSDDLIPESIDLILNINKSERIDFDINIILNIHDPHVETHILPFIKDIKKDVTKKIKLQVLFYDFKDHGQGHIALNFNLAQELIFSKIKSKQVLNTEMVSETSYEKKSYSDENQPEDHKFDSTLGEDLINKNWTDYVNQPLSTFSSEIFNSNLFNTLKTITFPERILKNNDYWVNSGYENNGFLFKEKSEWKFVHYGELKITFPINWSLGQPADNNLNWQLHSLTILKDLIKSHVITQQAWYVETAKEIILDWCRYNFVNNFPSQFSWNDHSTALRIVNISQFFLYLIRTENIDIPFFEICQEAVRKHLLVLITNKFYIKGTNHGLDQSFSLYQVSIIFSFIKESEQAKRVALERLTYELRQSFSNEYIHIENSPEYHLLILSSCLQINLFIADIEGDNVIQNITEFANGAIEYLGYIIRPDGCFPPIGDTLVKPIQLLQSFQYLSENNSYKGFLNAVTKGEQGRDFLHWHKVYPETGYAIFRGNPSLFLHKDRPHIVYKCGFLSSFHRQDDDNNIVVFAHGEEWLTDGGLYKHDYDPQREHMRSHYAHNIMAPENAKAERSYCPNPAPAIVDYSVNQPSAKVKGQTTMFKGFVFTREIYYDGELEFIVKDEGEKLEKIFECNHFEQYWQIPADKEISIEDNIINIKSICTTWIMQMSIDSINLLNIEQLKPTEGSYFCWRSSQYNVLEPVQVIKCKYSINENITQSLIKFNWIH